MLKINFIKTINFCFDAFGFENYSDFTKSSFGFMLSSKGLITYSCLGVLSQFTEENLGLPIFALLAFVLLNILEFFTGVFASKKKGERIESRKMGRMFLKVGSYILILWILNAFSSEIVLPEMVGMNIKPFSILYWGFVCGVIYQLYKSLMENGEVLGWKELRGVTRLTGSKLDNIFDSEKKEKKE